MKKLLKILFIIFISIGVNSIYAKEQEEFKKFTERFFKEPTFQKSRVKLPLTLIIQEPPDYTHTSELFEWSFIDYNKKNSECCSISFEEFDEKKNQEEVVLVLRGYGNGIGMLYKFKLIENRWYLVEIVDYSN